MFVIRTIVKKNPLIRKSYLKLENIFMPFLIKTTPVASCRYIYRRTTGKRLNLKKPEDFNEKLQWLNLYWQNPLLSKCADKYEVREYVENCGCGKSLNELYGVYEGTRRLEWEKFPRKFVLKCTHGCGFNIICDDKENIDREAEIKKLEKWLKIDYSLHAGEFHYSRIKPRIICERYLETDSGFLPNDYKIYCFNGKAKVILVCTDRVTGAKFSYMDLEWNRMDLGRDKYEASSTPIRPDSMDIMIDYAEKLSKPFPFVRVDFYEYGGKPVFGEMTFTPGRGAAVCYSEEGLKRLGDMIELPEKITGASGKL